MPDQSWLQGARICVVGGAGFLGRPTVELLSRRGAQVRGVSRRRPSGLPLNVEWLVGDIADESVLDPALRGAAGVIYMASNSLPASADADMTLEIERHVRVPIHVAERAAGEGVERFVFASSGGTVYGVQAGSAAREDDATLPLNAYGASKVAVEGFLRVLARARALSTVSLRIGNPYGEHQPTLRGQGFVLAAIQAALSGEPLKIWGDGSVVRDYVHVDDVAEAFVAALTHRGSEPAINVGSGEGRSLLDVVRAVETACGAAIDVRYEPGRAIDVPTNVLDISLAQACLGWRPSVPFEEGLRRTVKRRQRGVGAP